MQPAALVAGEFISPRTMKHRATILYDESEYKVLTGRDRASAATRQVLLIQNSRYLTIIGYS
jgi:hypothetical protein